jgi:hypothetical protein
VATSVAVSSGVNLDEGATTDRIRVELVSGNYFQVLGVQPAAGRFFGTAEDAVPDANPVVVVGAGGMFEPFHRMAAYATSGSVMSAQFGSSLKRRNTPRCRCSFRGPV